MFLDSNNCYYIDSTGLYVYWPEIGKVLFYAEKKGKTLKFVTLELDDDNQTLKYTGSTKGLMGLTKHITLFFKSQNTNEFFANFYITERKNKMELMKKRGQVDYLLVSKQSVKPGHISKVEYRIVRIDWGKQEIKYYGDEATFEVNGYIIPEAYPLDKKFSIYEIDSQIPSKPIPQEFINQLARNGNGHALLITAELDDIQTTSVNPGPGSSFFFLVKHMKKCKLFPDRYSEEKINNILNVLDSSILKDKWLEGVLASDDLKHYLTDMSSLAKDVHLERLVADPRSDKSTVYKYIINDASQLDRCNYSFNFDTEDIEFKFSKDLFAPQSENATALTNVKIANCGADNCYFIVKNRKGLQFGLRLSSNIYLQSDYGIYNLIIENLINCIIHFYFTNPILLGIGAYSIKEKLPEISAVLRFGFIKVNFTNSENEQLTGYIPYTLTEHKPEYITLSRYISKMCETNQDTMLTECEVEDFIKKILTYVYNFYVIARPYFKFNHNDFKTNNILINPDTNKIYIIDFGYAQINFYNGNRTFNLSNRIDFFEDKQGEYNFLVKNMNDIYSTDHDIETLLYWLINPYEFYDKSTKLNNKNPSNAKKFDYHRKVSAILGLMTPFTKTRPQASRDVKSVLGNYLYKCSNQNYPICLIEYRLYQMYTLFILKSSCSYEQFLINKDEANPYLKYFLEFNEDTYLKYQEFVSELTRCVQSTEPPMPAKSSTTAPAPGVLEVGAAVANPFSGGSIKKTKKYKNIKTKKAKTKQKYNK